MFRRFIATPGRTRRMTILAALLLSALIALPVSGVAMAQTPPADDISLVNGNRQMVERKKEGDFVARPIFSRQVSELHYSIRHPDTGEWITSTYRVQGGEKKLSEGWEYTFEYPALDEQPDLDPEQAFLLVLAVPRIGGGERHVFHALVPVHQPKGLWDWVLGTLKPDRWARVSVCCCSTIQSPANYSAKMSSHEGIDLESAGTTPQSSPAPPCAPWRPSPTTTPP